MGDQAVSPVIGLIIAVVVYSVAFTAMTRVASDPASSDDPDAPGHDAKAAEILETILTDPGFSQSGAEEWDQNPEDLARFGLADPNDTHSLDFDKIQKLRDAKMAADDTNDLADYPEVRAALGLDDTYDVHIRSYPIFMSVDDATWVKHKGLQVAYIAHGETATNPTGSAQVTGTVTNHTDHLRVAITVENTDAAPMAFKAAFELQMGGSVVSVDDQYTGLLAAGESETVEMRYYEVNDWADTGTVEVTVYDAYSNTLDTRLYADMTFPENNNPPADYNLLVDAADYYFTTGGTPHFYLDSYDGNGARVKAQGNDGPNVRVAVEDPSGTEVENETVTLNANKATDWSCDACTTTGDYTVKIMTTDAQRVVTDRFHVSIGDLFTQTKTMTEGAEYEAGLVEELVDGWENATYDPNTGAGDIFLDDNAVLSDHLVPKLESNEYDVLIVGSNVDHSEMTSGGVKWPIHDWVMEDGGDLVVLGNVAPNTQWLQPLYGSGITNANGGISTPDPTHPILHTPEPLRYSTYNDNGKAWRLTQNAEDYYTHVIRKDSGASQAEDVLAASKPGAFGNGTVVLTSYIPTDLTSPADPHEALKLLNNLVSHSYNMVFIDFGPEIPDGSAVSSESRIAMVRHPSLPDAQVEVEVVVYVWR